MYRRGFWLGGISEFWASATIGGLYVCKVKRRIFLHRMWGYYKMWMAKRWGISTPGEALSTYCKDEDRWQRGPRASSNIAVRTECQLLCSSDNDGWGCRDTVPFSNKKMVNWWGKCVGRTTDLRWKDGKFVHGPWNISERHWYAKKGLPQAILSTAGSIPYAWKLLSSFRGLELIPPGNSK